MLRLANRLTKSFDLVEDGVGRGSPNERLGVSAIMPDKLINLYYQIPRAAECSPSDDLMSSPYEPDLNLIQPRRIHRCEMNLISWMKSQPSFHSRMFMSRLIIHDQMNIEVFGHIGFDVFEKAEIFLMTMAAITLRG